MYFKKIKTIAIDFAHLLADVPKCSGFTVDAGPGAFRFFHACTLVSYHWMSLDPICVAEGAAIMPRPAFIPALISRILSSRQSYPIKLLGIPASNIKHYIVFR